ncbi:sigma factor-like helix-turn-helix DNA-binding protein [Jatrophihabitans fulvus]
MWRRETPHVLGALVRRYGDIGACEDAVQEALLAASRQWPEQGIPDSPRGWLLRVASRRLVDHRRSDTARELRERADVDAPPPGPVSERDDSLHLLLLCCHPALPRPAQVALTLRAVGGLTTRQIAAAHLVPEATMAQRISRAKTLLRGHDTTVAPVGAADLAGRVAATLDVLYLIFNEGYAASAGERLVDVSLADEAIRLTRMLVDALPAHDEAAGLLALQVLTRARTPARVDAAGDLVPLAEQDRSRWDASAVAEGIAIVERTLPRGPVGPFQLQAAVAAVHAEARHWADTDWPQIRELYRMLDRIAPGPAVTLNRAVAEAMVEGPGAGLTLLEPLRTDPALRRNHRLPAVRAHLLELAGRADEADTEYAAAARLTASAPEQRYLNRRRERLSRSRGRPA